MSSDLKKNPLVDSFLSTLRLEKGLSENTIKAYANDCKAFNQWLFLKKGYKAVSAIEEDIENYLKHLNSINLSSASINRKLSSIKHFFSYLSKAKLLKSNPVINISGLKSSKALPKSLSIICPKRFHDTNSHSTFSQVCILNINHHVLNFSSSSIKTKTAAQLPEDKHKPL